MEDSVYSKTNGSPLPGITELLDSDSETDNPQIVLDERMILEKPEARTPEARIPETTLTLGAVPANWQFAGVPAQVDLGAGRLTCSQATATVAVPLGYDTGVAAILLTGDDDIDEDFAFMVTNRQSL